MAIKQTGHAEIDQQHSILEKMLEKLACYCSVSKQNSKEPCDGCLIQKQDECAALVTSLVNDIRTFLVGHNAYEEKMMELLPNTPECRAHVEGHKRAHNGISNRLKQLSLQINKKNPYLAGKLMLEIAKDWLGDHSLGFDARLFYHLDKVPTPEINFDKELVSILDKYVFHNRPTQEISSHYINLATQRRKMEVRGRFESLSPAQCAVFWLIVSGKKNREIALELGCSVNTIKTHRAAIFNKLEVTSALELFKKVNKLS